MKMRLTGLLPIIDCATRVLILGSFPSEISRKKKEYYANPRNYFWKIISEVLRSQALLNYGQKKALLKKHKIGLWDAIGSCYRVGALDSRISEPILNDFDSLLKRYPNIRVMFLVGKKAYKLFKRRYPSLKIPCEYLPSTSPANARQSLILKIARWKRIRNYLIRNR